MPPSSRINQNGPIGTIRLSFILIGSLLIMFNIIKPINCINYQNYRYHPADSFYYSSRRSSDEVPPISSSSSSPSSSVVDSETPSSNVSTNGTSSFPSLNNLGNVTTMHLNGSTTPHLVISGRIATPHYQYSPVADPLAGYRAAHTHAHPVPVVNPQQIDANSGFRAAHTHAHPVPVISAQATQMRADATTSGASHTHAHPVPVNSQASQMRADSLVSGASHTHAHPVPVISAQATQMRADATTSGASHTHAHPVPVNSQASQMRADSLISGASHTHAHPVPVINSQATQMRTDSSQAGYYYSNSPLMANHTQWRSAIQPQIYYRQSAIPGMGLLNQTSSSLSQQFHQLTQPLQQMFNQTTAAVQNMMKPNSTIGSGIGTGAGVGIPGLFPAESAQPATDQVSAAAAAPAAAPASDENPDADSGSHRSLFSGFGLFGGGAEGKMMVEEVEEEYDEKPTLEIPKKKLLPKLGKKLDDDYEGGAKPIKKLPLKKLPVKKLKAKEKYDDGGDYGAKPAPANYNATAYGGGMMLPMVGGYPTTFPGQYRMDTSHAKGAFIPQFRSNTTTSINNTDSITPISGDPNDNSNNSTVETRATHSNGRRAILGHGNQYLQGYLAQEAPAAYATLFRQANGTGTSNNTMESRDTLMGRRAIMGANALHRQKGTVQQGTSKNSTTDERMKIFQSSINKISPLMELNSHYDGYSGAGIYKLESPHGSSRTYPYGAPPLAAAPAYPPLAAAPVYPPPPPPYAAAAAPAYPPPAAPAYPPLAAAPAYPPPAPAAYPPPAPYAAAAPAIPVFPSSYPKVLSKVLSAYPQAALPLATAGYNSSKYDYSMPVGVVNLFCSDPSYPCSCTLYLTEINKYNMLISGVCSGLQKDKYYLLNLYEYGDLTAGCSALGMYFGGGYGAKAGPFTNLGVVKADYNGVAFVNKLKRDSLSIMCDKYGSKSSILGRAIGLAEMVLPPLAPAAPAYGAAPAAALPLPLPLPAAGYGAAPALPLPLPLPAAGYGAAPALPLPLPLPAAGYGAAPALPLPLPLPAAGYGAAPALPLPLPAAGYGAAPALPLPLPAAGYGAAPALPLPLPAAGYSAAPALPLALGLGGGAYRQQQNQTSAAKTTGTPKTNLTGAERRSLPLPAAGGYGAAPALPLALPAAGYGAAPALPLPLPLPAAGYGAAPAAALPLPAAGYGAAPALSLPLPLPAAGYGAPLGLGLGLAPPKVIACGVIGLANKDNSYETRELKSKLIATAEMEEQIQQRQVQEQAQQAQQQLQQQLQQQGQQQHKQHQKSRPKQQQQSKSKQQTNQQQTSQTVRQ